MYSCLFSILVFLCLFISSKCLIFPLFAWFLISLLLVSLFTFLETFPHRLSLKRLQLRASVRWSSQYFSECRLHLPIPRLRVLELHCRACGTSALLRWPLSKTLQLFLPNYWLFPLLLHFHPPILLTAFLFLRVFQGVDESVKALSKFVCNSSVTLAI